MVPKPTTHTAQDATASTEISRLENGVLSHDVVPGTSGEGIQDDALGEGALEGSKDEDEEQSEDEDKSESEDEEDEEEDDGEGSDTLLSRRAKKTKTAARAKGRPKVQPKPKIPAAKLLELESWWATAVISDELCKATDALSKEARGCRILNLSLCDDYDLQRESNIAFNRASLDKIVDPRPWTPDPSTSSTLLPRMPPPIEPSSLHPTSLALAHSPPHVPFAAGLLLPVSAPLSACLWSLPSAPLQPPSIAVLPPPLTAALLSMSSSIVPTAVAAAKPPLPLASSNMCAPPSRFLFHSVNPNGWPDWVEVGYMTLTEAGLGDSFQRAVIAWTELERLHKFESKVSYPTSTSCMYILIRLFHSVACQLAGILHKSIFGWATNAATI